MTTGERASFRLGKLGNLHGPAMGSVETGERAQMTPNAFPTLPKAASALSMSAALKELRLLQNNRARKIAIPTLQSYHVHAALKTLQSIDRRRWRSREPRAGQTAGYIME